MQSITATAYSHKAHNLLCHDALIAKKTPQNAAGVVRRSDFFGGFGVFSPAWLVGWRIAQKYKAQRHIDVGPWLSDTWCGVKG